MCSCLPHAVVPSFIQLSLPALCPPCLAILCARHARCQTHLRLCVRNFSSSSSFGTLLEGEGLVENTSLPKRRRCRLAFAFAAYGTWGGLGQQLRCKAALRLAAIAGWRARAAAAHMDADSRRAFLFLAIRSASRALPHSQESGKGGRRIFHRGNNDTTAARLTFFDLIVFPGISKARKCRAGQIPTS